MSRARLPVAPDADARPETGASIVVTAGVPLADSEAGETVRQDGIPPTVAAPGSRHLRREEAVPREARPPAILLSELRRLTDVWGAFPGISTDLRLAILDMDERHPEACEVAS